MSSSLISIQCAHILSIGSLRKRANLRKDICSFSELLFLVIFAHFNKVCRYFINWLYLTVHCSIWFHMALHGCTWQSMPLNGCTWVYMVVHASTRLYMLQKFYIAVNGSKWQYMALCGCTWLYMLSHEQPCRAM